MTEQPEALRLANWLDAMPSSGYALTNQAAAELRRLHEEVTEQGRLLSMSAERELALLARIDRLEKLNAELLEALKLMVKQFTKGSGHSTVKDSEARIKAHAAIAKATGETK